jgi:hypothetical protein
MGWLPRSINRECLYYVRTGNRDGQKTLHDYRCCPALSISDYWKLGLLKNLSRSPYPPRIRKKTMCKQVLVEELYRTYDPTKGKVRMTGGVEIQRIDAFPDNAHPTEYKFKCTNGHGAFEAVFRGSSTIAIYQ